MSDDNVSEVTIIVEHNGKVYRLGPHRIVATARPADLDSHTKEILYTAGRLAVNIVRDIKHFAEKKK